MGIYIWYNPCVLEDAYTYTGDGDRLQQGERTLSLIFGSGAGDCALGAILSSTCNWVKGTCGGC